MMGEASWTDCATQVVAIPQNSDRVATQHCYGTGNGREGAGLVYSAGHSYRDQGEEYETQHVPVSLTASNVPATYNVPHSMPANEACRSLRSCLRHHAKKENGKFVRKNSTNLIEYALRKVGILLDLVFCQ